jgi:formimidoylglutamate deiminase
VHAIHITADEIELLARANATVCSCPTTERNLGDGVIVADQVMREGIRIAFGSDSQAQIDPMEDARELEYHLRLERQQRAILDQIGEQALASRLFDCAAVHGARALGVPASGLAAGSSADFFTVDLDDVSIAGNSGNDLLPLAVFSLGRTAIRDVVVNGRWVVRDQRHPLQEEIVSRFKAVHRRLWGSG